MSLSNYINFVSQKIYINKVITGKKNYPSETK